MSKVRTVCDNKYLIFMHINSVICDGVHGDFTKPRTSESESKHGDSKGTDTPKTSKSMSKYENGKITYTKRTGNEYNECTICLGKEAPSINRIISGETHVFVGNYFKFYKKQINIFHVNVILFVFQLKVTKSLLN